MKAINQVNPDLIQYCAKCLSLFVYVCQEYQDHHSEEDDGDLYEKIANTERDEKLVGGTDKRRGTLTVKQNHV